MNFMELSGTLFQSLKVQVRAWGGVPPHAPPRTLSLSHARAHAHALTRTRTCSIARAGAHTSTHTSAHAQNTFFRFDKECPERYQPDKYCFEDPSHRFYQVGVWELHLPRTLCPLRTRHSLLHAGQNRLC